ncbi:hypothetical protein [Pseudomonas sp. NPDC007930]|uniref:hypothetical protein n=1 Tax=Pseudomonas sp. NPDC007930 TaxID=3364417 RepID=UPI0036ED72EB
MPSTLPFNSFCQAIAQALCDDGVACDAVRLRHGVHATLKAMGLYGRTEPLPAPALLIQPFLERWVPLLESELGLTSDGQQDEVRFRDMPALNARLAQLRQAAPRKAVRMELDLPSFCEGLSQALAADGVQVPARWVESTWLAVVGAEHGEAQGLRREDGRWKLELGTLAQHYPAWLMRLAAVLGVAGQPAGWLHAWPHAQAKLEQLEQVLHTQLELAGGKVGGFRGWVGQAIAAAAAGEPAEQVNARVHRARFGLRAVQ